MGYHCFVTNAIDYEKAVYDIESYVLDSLSDSWKIYIPMVISEDNELFINDDFYYGFNEIGLNSLEKLNEFYKTEISESYNESCVFIKNLSNKCDNLDSITYCEWNELEEIAIFRRWCTTSKIIKNDFSFNILTDEFLEYDYTRDGVTNFYDPKSDSKSDKKYVVVCYIK